MRVAHAVAAERTRRGVAKVVERAPELGQRAAFVEMMAVDELCAVHHRIGKLAYRQRPALFTDQLAGSGSNGVQVRIHEHVLVRKGACAMGLFMMRAVKAISSRADDLAIHPSQYNFNYLPNNCERNQFQSIDL